MNEFNLLMDEYTSIYLRKGKLGNVYTKMWGGDVIF